MNRSDLPIEDRAENIYRTIQRTHGERGVFIIRGAFRTCSIYDQRFARALETPHMCEFVGVYNELAKKSWLQEDMEWSMERWKRWHL